MVITRNGEYLALLINFRMESQNIEVTFPNYNKQGSRFLKIINQMQQIQCRSERHTRSEIGFQIQEDCIHVFTTQSKWMMPSTKAPFMLATLKSNFYSIKNKPEQTLTFRAKIGDFVSNILVCKKDIEQIKLVISKEHLYFYISDKNTNGFINYQMPRLFEPKTYFSQRVEELIMLGELSEAFLEDVKRDVSIRNISLLERGISFVRDLNGIKYSEKVVQSPRFLTNYNHENFWMVLGNRLTLRLGQSAVKHCSFCKSLRLHSVVLKLYPIDLERFDEAQLILEFQNDDYHVFKALPCELQFTSEAATNPVIERNFMPTSLASLNNQLPANNTTKQQQGFQKLERPNQPAPDQTIATYQQQRKVKQNLDQYHNQDQQPISLAREYKTRLVEDIMMEGVMNISKVEEDRQQYQEDQHEKRLMEDLLRRNKIPKMAKQKILKKEK